jgi:hypothetical protein
VTTTHEAAEVLRQTLAEGELDWEEAHEGVFDVVLPGQRKLQTPVRLEVGPHALGVHAFVCRKPDENFEGVYRWLLERNLRMFGVAFALDAVGDIFLDARLPLTVVTPDEVDRLLGSLRPNTGAPLPKGMSAETLREVTGCLRAASRGLSAPEVAAEVGASRVTVRRYLEHLADRGRAERQQRYGGGGRPEVEYRWRS